MSSLYFARQGLETRDDIYLRSAELAVPQYYAVAFGDYPHFCKQYNGQHNLPRLYPYHR